MKSNLQLDEWQKGILKAKGDLVVCSGRQTGKSTIIAIKAADFVTTYQKKSVLIISATERQAEELFIKVLFYIQDNYKQFIKKGKQRPTKSTLRLTNGSIIRCLPTGLSGLGIRGYTVDLLIADEAAFVPEAVWSAVTPMLLTTGGEIILISTPHGRKGYFYDCYQRGVEGQDFTTFHVNSEEIMLNRPLTETWDIYQREAAIKRLDLERDRMTDNQYKQEYLGVFVDDLMQFFPDELIKSCMTATRKGINREGRYYLGVDIARLGEDESTFEILELKDDRLFHRENQITRKTLLSETTNHIIALNKQYQFRRIYVDDGGIGVGVFDYLLSHPETKTKVIPINNAQRVLDSDDKRKKKLLKEDLYNNLLRLMEQAKISLLDDAEVFQSLKSVQYEYVTSNFGETMLKIFGNYTHIVEGLIRAAWCIKDKSLNIFVNYSSYKKNRKMSFNELWFA